VPAIPPAPPISGIPIPPAPPIGGIPSPSVPPIIDPGDIFPDIHGDAALYWQRDTNHDGRPDQWACDTDGNGKADAWAYDIDGDGKPDKWAYDIDGDGKPDKWAYDTDGDGIADKWSYYATGRDGQRRLENAYDTDGDKKPDFWTGDWTGDGKIDRWAYDTNGDGDPDKWVSDNTGDGKPDRWSFDKDHDGKADYWERDTNGDGKPEEYGLDTDGDGKPDRWLAFPGGSKGSATARYAAKKSTINPDVLEKLRAFLRQREFEGFVGHMYVDQDGKVHVGIGFNIDSEQACLRYKWFRSDNTRATNQEVVEEWHRIRKLAPEFKGKGAAKIKAKTTLHMLESDIHTAFTEKAKWRDRVLRTRLPQYSDAPADAQLAMLVHAWASNPATLAKKWPLYLGACTAHDWDHAWIESHWKDMNPKRYDAMKTMFSNAEAVEDGKAAGGTNYDLRKVYYPDKLPTR
jgi:hypothetical protein